MYMHLMQWIVLIYNFIDCDLSKDLRLTIQMKNLIIFWYV